VRVIACLVLAACTVHEDTALQPITNGSDDAGDPAVVAIVDASDEVLCTASVIGPHTGITAAHCFTGPPARTLRIFFGSTLVAGGVLTAVADARQHPAFDASTFAHDVAVFTFRDPSPVPPLALDGRTLDASVVGTTFAAVGFGITSAAPDTGVKRTGIAKISDVQSDELTTVPDPAQPCHGDSGGPMLIAPDAVAAVVSHGDAACADHAIYARIDVARPVLVDPYVAATAPGTAHTGDACFYDGHCAEGPCLQAKDDPLLYFCSQACARDSDCPDAMECAADGCRYREPSPGAIGSPCTADAECTTSTCRAGACTASCFGAPDVCPSGYECRGEGLSQYCVATSPGGCGCGASSGGAPPWLFVAGWLAWYARSRQRYTSRTSESAWHPRDDLDLAHVVSDFEDSDTDASGERAGGTRIQAVISVNGAVTTKLLPRSGELSIGRSSACDLAINDASVSRRHARLRMSPLEIIDEGSRNGTRVRGKPVASGVPTSLSVGDAIHIGEAAILLQRFTPSLERTGASTSIPGVEMPAPEIDAECERSARTGAPFAVVYVAADHDDAGNLVRLVRGALRTTDTVKPDGNGELQVLLVDTGGEHVTYTVERLAQVLRGQGIRARFGVARYPDDGVVGEQLVAHAYEQVERERLGLPSAMDPVREIVRQVAEGELSVLITGETGVGKELCAEQIHRLSPRATGPFIKFNCSALVESLIESELFGHERGAFTGALSASPGLLETGDGGTVFLDEIGELPLGVQAKLLRVIEERIVRRVGATAGKKIDVRFVFATNRDLLEEVAAGRFRRDLYYRINGVTIAIPPLRERRTEIAALARAFASRAKPGARIVLGSEVIAALEQHSWPGNVRELRNTIERAVLLSSGGVIRPSHLVLAPPREPARDPLRDSQATMPVERWPAEPDSNDLRGYEPPLRPSELTMRRSSGSLATEVAELERKRIVEALERYGGNQTQVARALGVSRGTLIARMDQYGLRRPRKRDDD
jgi:MYXO-CTERM domain-containing protein